MQRWTVPLSTRGRITLPKALRNHLELKPYEKLLMIEEDDGSLVIRRPAAIFDEPSTDVGECPDQCLGSGQSPT